MQNSGGAAAAPTGCFKCGRPGHWSRDCPSSSNPNPNPITTISSSNTFKQAPSKAAVNSGKKAPRSRPKLTPDLLLSDDGLGYVLRHFPRNFKYHGRGHEVEDLGNLIGMYAEWHSHVLPYYSFDQFIGKVEQVGASKRVRRCITELRERVARGGDPTKLHETPVEVVDPDEDEGMGLEEPTHGTEDHEAPRAEEMMNEIYQTAANHSCSPEQESGQVAAPPLAAAAELPIQTPDGEQRKVHITDEQRARMEANRLKALERAKQARSSQLP